MSEETEATIRAFASTDEQKRGDITVELGCNGVPVEASEFAELILNTVKTLNAVAKCVEGESPKWAIIEANVIGSAASFTLKGYDKAAFKVKKKQEAS